MNILGQNPDACWSILCYFLLSWREEFQKQKTQQASATNKITAQVNVAEF